MTTKKQDNRKGWVVNVTSKEGGEKVCIVWADTPSEGFELGRKLYQTMTGREGIQLSISAL